MAFDFGGKQKAEEKFREELRVLATQIETVNQQLSQGGAGGAGGPALAKSFQDMNSKLQYLYELIKGFQAEVKEDIKESLTEVRKSVNQTLEKNLGDVYTVQKQSQEEMTAMQKQLAESPAFNTGEFGNMRETLTELVKIYREEAEVFRRQNEYLQQRLAAIEKKLDKK